MQIFIITTIVTIVTNELIVHNDYQYMSKVKRKIDAFKIFSNNFKNVFISEDNVDRFN